MKIENNKIYIDLEDLKIYKEESSCFAALYDMSFDGETTIKIKSRCLEKALDFCTRRPDDPQKDDFDCDFLGLVEQSGLDYIDLILAAVKLGIYNLVNLLFEKVFYIVCNKKTPEQLEKIFKVRYHVGRRCGDFFWIDGLLNSLPPCPTLSEKEREEMTENDHYRRIIVSESPDEIKYLTESERRYWVYAHLAFQCNPSVFTMMNQLSAEGAAAAIKKEEEEDAPIIVVSNSFSKKQAPIIDVMNSFSNLHGETSIKLHGKYVSINEFYAMESELLWGTDNGEIPITKIINPFREKALEFCVRRALFRRKYCFMSSTFVVTLFDGILHEDLIGLDHVHLIHTAGRLGIHSLFNLLFEDVVPIICKKKNPEKIFKVRYNGDTCRKINKILDLVPPCPKLSKAQQEEMKREYILKTYDFDALSDSQKRYWVYAHLVTNLSDDLEEHEDEEEQEESKIPKTTDDVGGPGPRGQAWKK